MLRAKTFLPENRICTEDIDDMMLFGYELFKKSSILTFNIELDVLKK